MADRGTSTSQPSSLCNHCFCRSKTVDCDMSDRGLRTSLSRRQLLAAAAALTLGLLLLLYWRQIVALGLGAAALHVNSRIHGKKKRRPPAFAKNVLALSAAYAVWNSRWLSPQHAKIHAGTPGTCTNPDGTIDSYPPTEPEPSNPPDDEIPY